jgi:large subunit ribosomal protein L10Ae
VRRSGLQPDFLAKNLCSSSKLSVSSVRGSIKDLLTHSADEKRRNFVETVELQIGLKNYDPQRDKRFSGTVKCVHPLPSTDSMIDTISRLPHVPRPRMSICILADAADIDRAKQIELEYMSVDDLKKCVSCSLLPLSLSDCP